MVASTISLPRALRTSHLNNRPSREDRLVPREKVEAMLHEIAYVLHVTRKIKKQIIESK